MTEINNNNIICNKCNKKAEYYNIKQKEYYCDKCNLLFGENSIEINKMYSNCLIHNKKNIFYCEKHQQHYCDSCNHDCPDKIKLSEIKIDKSKINEKLKKIKEIKIYFNNVMNSILNEINEFIKGFNYALLINETIINTYNKIQDNYMIIHNLEFISDILTEDFTQLVKGIPDLLNKIINDSFTKNKEQLNKIINNNSSIKEELFKKTENNEIIKLFESPKTDYKHLFKYMIIGESGTGKSNIMRKFVNENFIEQHLLTNENNLRSCFLKSKDSIYKLQIWDTPGNEKFYSSIDFRSFKNVICFLVVYDITNRNSFDKVDKYISDIKQYSSGYALLYLIGNKIDLENERVVTKEEGQKLADKYGIKFYEISAKDNKNIDEIFYSATLEIANKI